MAGRKKRRPIKRKVKNSTKLSESTRHNLQRSAERARRIIKSAAETGEYETPNPRDYLYSALIKRYEQGENIRNIIKEVKSITPTSVRSQPIEHHITELGYDVSGIQYRQIKEEVDKANANIRAARKKFKSIIEAMPEELQTEDIVKGIANERSIENILQDLQLYTPENLIPYANPETGELMGTVAEYEYNAAKLRRENERRRREQEKLNPNQNPDVQFLRVQEVYDKQQINIEKIPTMDALRRRASTWDDLQRIQRANLWVKNYSDTMELLEVYLKQHQIWNETIEGRFKYISSVLNRLINNEEAISFVSKQMPTLQISAVSDLVTGAINFNEIYEAWIDVDDEWFE